MTIWLLMIWPISNYINDDSNVWNQLLMINIIENVWKVMMMKMIINDNDISMKVENVTMILVLVWQYIIGIINDIDD